MARTKQTARKTPEEIERDARKAREIAEAKAQAEAEAKAAKARAKLTKEAYVEELMAGKYKGKPAAGKGEKSGERRETQR